MYKMYLPLKFLVLRDMIQYHNMILLSPLSSLISVSHHIFGNIACIIVLIILALGLV
jgi:hypothetical protein